MDLKSLLEVLNKELPKVTLEGCFPDNIYLFGSRLYGNYRVDSDWDFIITVKGPYFPGPRLIENETLNANLLHRDFFQAMLDDNIIWILMLVFLPKEFIWLENTKYKVQIKKPFLRKAIFADVNHHFAKAKRLWREGDFKKSKKNLIHGLRYQEFAIQALKTGNITDFTCCNALNDEISKIEATSWEAFENKYAPIYRSKGHEINALLEPLPIALDVKTPLKVIAYIKKYGPDSVSKELAIAVKFHKEFPNLMFMMADRVTSPVEHPIVQECNGTILDMDQDCKIIALPNERIFKYGEEIAPDVDWKSAKVYEKVDGNAAVMYYYKGYWHVSSKDSADGSEEFITEVSEDKLHQLSQRLSYNPWKYFDDAAAKELESCSFLEVTSTKSKEMYIFRDLFWKIFRENNYQLPPEEFKDHIFVFELCSSLQSLSISRGKFTDGNKENLLLHCVRNMQTLKEVDVYLISSKLGWKCVPKLFENEKVTYQTLSAFCTDLDPMECSGFVVCDKLFRRLKVLSPQYQALRTLLWNSDDYNRNHKMMLEIVRMNDFCTFLNRYPKWKPLYEQVKKEYDEFCSALDSKFQTIKDLEIKDFLNVVKDSPFKKPLCDFRGKTAKCYKELFRDSPKNPITYISSLMKIYQKDKQIN